MECREVCEKMYDYIDHQLSQKEIKDFEEHMKYCKHCQDEYYRLEKLIVKLKNIKDVEPPKNLKNKILNNIKKEEKQPSKIVYFKKYSYVAATIVVFVCGFYIIKAMETNTVKNNLYTAQKIQSSKDITIEGEQDTTSLTIKGKNAEETQETTTNSLARERIQPSTTEETKDVISKGVAGQEENMPRASNQGMARTFEQDSRQINQQETEQTLTYNKEYFYEKNITEDMKTKSFKHDIALYKNQTCKVFFENNGVEDVTLYIENIDGNKVSQDVIVNKKDKNNMEFYMTDEDIEQGVYTISIDSINSNLQGYLKIEVANKE